MIYAAYRRNKDLIMTSDNSVQTEVIRLLDIMN